MVETHYSIHSCPFSIALLTDSHNRSAAQILESLNRQRPSLILLAGDFVYAAPPSVPGLLKMQESRNAVDLLTGCAAIAPTFVSLGNHEWMLHESDLNLLSSFGVTVLDNSFSSITISGSLLCCGGLSSARFTAYQEWRLSQSKALFYPEPPKTIWTNKPEPRLDWLNQYMQQGGYKILLCHHPEYISRYLRQYPIDLILSGHAHGGQWRYYSRRNKRWRGLYAPDQGLFPSLTEGIHGNLVISRGLSNTTLIPRLQNPPEIVYING